MANGAEKVADWMNTAVIIGAGILLTIAGAIFFGLLLIIGIVLIGIGIILELNDRDLLWLKR